jgi:hypothetical protein
MDSSALLARQGQRLLQIGVALFLFTSFEGFAEMVGCSCSPHLMLQHSSRLEKRRVAS